MKINEWLDKFFEKPGASKIIVYTMFVGMLLGFGLNYFRRSPLSAKGFEPAQLTANLKYDTVRAGKDTCVVQRDGAEMYDRPSAMRGKVLIALSGGQKVDYIGEEPSLDTEEGKGLTTIDINRAKLIFNSYRIPKGTVVDVTGFEESTGRYIINTVVDGKRIETHVRKEGINLGYTGQWKKVRFNKQDGYVRYNDLTQPAFM